MIGPTVAELLKQAKREKWVNPHQMLTATGRRYLHQATGWGSEPRYTIWTIDAARGIKSWDRDEWKKNAVEWPRLPSHWAPITFNRMTTWIEVDADDPAAGRRPCGLHGDCERPAVPDNPDHRCAMHAAADRKRAESTAKWRSNWDRQREEGVRAHQVADEITKEWNEVCDMLDIVHRGDPPHAGHTASRVNVDSEVLAMFLRQIKQMLS